VNPARGVGIDNVRAQFVHVTVKAQSHSSFSQATEKLIACNLVIGSNGVMPDRDSEVPGVLAQLSAAFA
jgi:hypothetical protein